VPKIALIPGLAATAAMYGPAFDALDGDIVRVDWPARAYPKSIEELADRVLESTPVSDCDVVVGSSLGGMVGAEIAQRTSPRALVLIGSAREPREVNMLLRQIAKMGDRLPVEHLQSLMGLDFLAGRAPILAMLAQADPDQVRAMAGAIFAWRGRPVPACPSPRIHGAWDLVIPPPPDGARIVPRAGHMLAMTHAEVVVEWLGEVLRDVAA